MRRGDRITELYAYVCIDPYDDCEGLPAIDGLDEARMRIKMPLVGADMERMVSLEPLVRDLARNTGKAFTLRRYTNMEIIKEIKP